MICPHCLKTVDDGTTFCPHCSAYLGGAPSRADYVFCEGCGARLSEHDRTCPKCGRPAPGILSTDSSSSDLAAGRTASFPRLTQRMIDTSLDARPAAPSAARVLSDSIDPSSTNVLDAGDIERASRPPAPADGSDPYHREPRRFVKPLVTALVLLALAGGGAYFVVEDPFGVMPGLIESFENAASDMYPSRQLPQGSAVDAPVTDPAASQGAAPETDEEVYRFLSSSHKKIVSAFESLDVIIEDYEYGFLASDRAVREEKSASAYGARDLVDSVVEDLEGLELPADSPYAEDVDHLLQLAGWVRTRLDVYCASWDISLSFGAGDAPSGHSDEILAPLRERSQQDQEARDQYFAHVDEWEPVLKSS